MSDGNVAGKTAAMEIARFPGEPSGGECLSSEAVRALYETHRKELLAFLIGVLRDVTAAQDVSQITFFRLIEVGHTASGETIKGWIFKVALREALVYRRQEARLERHLKQYSGGSESSLWTRSFEDELKRDQDLAELRELLARLPSDQLFVVRQRIYEDKTFAAIAEELNLPLGTVLTRMRLALEKIRKWFGENGV